MKGVKKKYGSAVEHLCAIVDALRAELPETLTDRQRALLREAVDEAFRVGRRTMTTDDWCDS